MRGPRSRRLIRAILKLESSKVKSSKVKSSDVTTKIKIGMLSVKFSIVIMLMIILDSSKTQHHWAPFPPRILSSGL